MCQSYQKIMYNSWVCKNVQKRNQQMLLAAVWCWKAFVLWVVMYVVENMEVNPKASCLFYSPVLVVSCVVFWPPVCKVLWCYLLYGDCKAKWSVFVCVWTSVGQLQLCGLWWIYRNQRAGWSESGDCSAAEVCSCYETQSSCRIL